MATLTAVVPFSWVRFLLVWINTLLQIIEEMGLRKDQLNHKCFEIWKPSWSWSFLIAFHFPFLSQDVFQFFFCNLTSCFCNLISIVGRMPFLAPSVQPFSSCVFLGELYSLGCDNLHETVYLAQIQILSVMWILFVPTLLIAWNSHTEAVTAHICPPSLGLVVLLYCFLMMLAFVQTGHHLISSVPY